MTPRCLIASICKACRSFQNANAADQELIRVHPFPSIYALVIPIMKHCTILLLSVALPNLLLADTTLIHNINGYTLDANRSLQQFTAIQITDEAAAARALKAPVPVRQRQPDPDLGAIGCRRMRDNGGHEAGVVLLIHDHRLDRGVRERKFSKSFRSAYRRKSRIQRLQRWLGGGSGIQSARNQ